MKFAKKYLLIDQDHYERLTSPKVSKSEDGIFTHPDVKAAKYEQKRMEAIADDTSLTDAEKLEQHSQVLKRYLENFKDAVSLSKSKALLGESRSHYSSQTDPNQVIHKDITQQPLKSETEIEKIPTKMMTSKIKPSTKESQSIEEIVKNISTNKRTKARKLLANIADNESLRWTNRGSVIYQGKALRGSDITKLVSDSVGSPLQISSKRSVWKKFNEILGEVGITTNQTGSGLVDYSKHKLMKPSKWISYE